MTGYLRALGAMAVGQSARLRPRPRARFEPAELGSEPMAGWLGAEHEAGWLGEVHEELPAGPAGWPPGSAAASPVRPQVHPPATAVPPAGSWPVLPPAGSPGPAPSSGPPAPVQPAAPATGPGPVAPATSAPPSTPVPAGEAPPPAQPVGAWPGAAAREGARHERVVVERVVREVAPVQDRAAGRLGRQPPPPAEPDQVRPQARPPAVQARIAARPPREPEPPAAAPPPVIQVSVGRIEVRAVPPAFPAPALPARPAPAPTAGAPALEDYLAGLGGAR